MKPSNSVLSDVLSVSPLIGFILRVSELPSGFCRSDVRALRGSQNFVRFLNQRRLQELRAHTHVSRVFFGAAPRWLMGLLRHWCGHVRHVFHGAGSRTARQNGPVVPLNPHTDESCRRLPEQRTPMSATAADKVASGADFRQYRCGFWANCR